MYAILVWLIDINRSYGIDVRSVYIFRETTLLSNHLMMMTVVLWATVRIAEPIRTMHRAGHVVRTI